MIKIFLTDDNLDIDKIISLFLRVKYDFYGSREPSRNVLRRITLAATEIT